MTTAADRREENRARGDAAEARLRETVREIAAAAKATKPDPRGVLTYRTYQTMGLVCVLVVRHRDGQASFHCSKSGNDLRFNLAFSKCIREPESTDDFLLICIPKWIAQDRGLMGVTPPLDGEWTDEQRAIWGRLTRARGTINTRIHYANRLRASNFRRSEVA